MEHAGDKLAAVVAAQVPGLVMGTASSKTLTTSRAAIRRQAAMSMQ